MLPLPAVCFGSGGGGFAFGAGFGFAFGLLLFFSASHSCFVLKNSFCVVFNISFFTFICFVALGLGGGAGAGASSSPGFGAAIAFALGRGGADFFRGGPKVSGGPLAVGMEDGGSASAITSFCTDLPQPLPFAEALLFLPSSVWTIAGDVFLPFDAALRHPAASGTGTDAGPSIPSGCLALWPAGDLVFGPTDFALCRSLAIVLTFVGGDGS